MMIGHLIAADYLDPDEAPFEFVDIRGIPQQEVFRAFYQIAAPIGMSHSWYVSGDISDEVIEETLKCDSHLAYVKGRYMAIAFVIRECKECIEVGRFNVMYGANKAQEIVQRLRSK